MIIHILQIQAILNWIFRHFAKYFHTDPSTKLPPGFTRAGNRFWNSFWRWDYNFLLKGGLLKVHRVIRKTSLCAGWGKCYQVRIWDYDCEQSCPMLMYRGHLVVKHDSLGEILLQATEMSEARQVTIFVEMFELVFQNSFPGDWRPLPRVAWVDGWALTVFSSASYFFQVKGLYCRVLFQDIFLVHYFWYLQKQSLS